MKTHFNKVAVIGVGLLGGSLGLALKQRRLADQVCGAGHRQATLGKALESGAIDAAFLDAAEAARGADLVVICTPAATVPGYLDVLRPVCPDGVITDVASTKAVISAHARATWPAPVRFVGSHPMAGSEKFGPEYARADLYEGCVVVVEDSQHVDPDARASVVALWRGLGADVLLLAPDLHDRLVARTSHMPHVVAAAIARAALHAADSGECLRKLVGKGFRDVTRIAASRPEIWRDICLTNRAYVLESVTAVMEELEQARRALEQGDGDALDRFFREGGNARREVLGE